METRQQRKEEARKYGRMVARKELPKDDPRAFFHPIINATHPEGNRLASYSQVEVLTRHGIPAINISFKHASELIEKVKANGWRRLSDSVVSGVVSRERSAGED
jgi:hypothetical protein